MVLASFKRLRLSALTAAALLALALSCGEPLGPQPSRWQERARFPADVRRVEGLAVHPNGSVYFAAETRDNRGVIYRYDGSALKEVFRAPYEDSVFSAVGCGAGIWAVGSKGGGGPLDGYCVRSADGATWEEVPVPASTDVGGAVFVRPNGFVWARGGDSKGGAIYTYQKGNWCRHSVAPGAVELGLAVTAGGRAYAAYVAENREPMVALSDDGGKSWTEEELPVGYGMYEVRSLDLAKSAAAGEALYITAVFYAEELNLVMKGIIGRDDAAPGEGEYSVAFAAPPGPFFTDINAMAFRSPSEGYAVGPLTSIAVERGGWAKEIISEAWSPLFRLAAVGPSSYWAIVHPSELSQDPILYEATLE